MNWHEFKALGTEIIFFLPNIENSGIIFKRAEKSIQEFESRFSRFIPGNELAEFNSSPAGERRVSELLLALLRAAQAYYLKTEGIFDPTVISSLEDWGYDRDFLELKDSELSLAALDLEEMRARFLRRGKMADLKINDDLVSRPPSFRIDLGGLGKGFIVDNLGTGIFAELPDFLISAGGDILASGNQEGQTGWDVALQNPLSPESNILFLNTRGEHLGIATSGVLERTWKKAGIKVNHLINPRSGLPVSNNIVSVTVIAANATQADVYAKTVLILGVEAGLEFIEREADVACIIFLIDGELIFSRRARHYLKS